MRKEEKEGCESGVCQALQGAQRQLTVPLCTLGSEQTELLVGPNTIIEMVG